METYILKIVLCSSTFIALYYLFLEREKIHQFNRFYLISSILFSLMIPFFSITYGTTPTVSQEILLDGSSSAINPTFEKKSIFTIQNIVLAIYLMVALVLFTRFLVNLISLKRKIKQGKKVVDGKITFILKEEKTTPHSFLHYIFLDRKSFENGKIDQKIIEHEKTHVSQKHGIDLLFIEFLLVVLWFNPAFYFYKRAILANHEFIADEKVLQKNPELDDYKRLLLAELISENILFINKFNFNNTKKRFIMMTKKTTSIAKLKRYLVLPISAALFFVFVEKVPAQKEKLNRSENQKMDRAVPIDMQNATLEEKEIIKNFEALLKTEKIIKRDTLKPKNVKEKQNVPPPPPSAPSREMKSENAELPPPPPPVEKLPSFPGGMNNLRTEIFRNFNTSALNGDERILKTTIFFNIDKNGKSSNFKTYGENEIFNKEVMKAGIAATENITWEPATRYGKPVDFQFSIPLTMVLEGNSK